MTARGWTRRAGWVPADIAGIGLTAAQLAAALGTGRVARTDEHDPRRSRHGSCGCRTGHAGGPDQRIVHSELKVAAPAVALGADPADHPGLLQYPEMMCHQVRGQAKFGSSSPGEASPGTRRSTIASRAGSPRAANTATRRSSGSTRSPPDLDYSTYIASSMVDPCRASSPRLLRCIAGWEPAAGHRPAGHRRGRIRHRRGDPLAGRRRAAAVRERHRNGVRAGVLILIFGPVSGGHFNPVVSAVDWLLGRRHGTGLTGTEVVAYAARRRGVLAAIWRT